MKATEQYFYVFHEEPLRKSALSNTFCAVLLIIPGGFPFSVCVGDLTNPNFKIFLNFRKVILKQSTHQNGSKSLRTCKKTSSHIKHKFVTVVALTCSITHLMV